MKIMMLLIGHDFPPDIRVEKEARALLSAGHQVVLVCENRKNRPPRENWNGVEIIRLPRLSSWRRRFNRARLFITLHSPLWERAISNIVKVEKPDVLHVHDLPFVGPGLSIAKQFPNLPLVADLHENYPALLQIRRQAINNPLDTLVFNPRRFASYERRILPQCDRIIVVVEEAAERVERLGIPGEKIVIVGNTEDIDAVGVVEGDDEIELPPSELVLLYVGNIGPHRGLDVAVRAMPDILEQVPAAMLVIVGDGTFRQRVERLAHTMGVSQAVRFEGHQPFSKVHRYIQASDICLVPHLANAHTNTTMPHKLFQYMYMKKPVIVSTAAPLARVVRETHSGLIFESGDPVSLAHCLLQLRDPAVRDRMGDNGYRAVMERYNWRHDAEHLIELYQDINSQTKIPR